MNAPSTTSPADARIVKFAFIAGNLTSFLVAVVVVGLLILRIGPDAFLHKLSRAYHLAAGNVRVLELPAEVRAELGSLGAVVENADNPTDVRSHDTILTRPDPDLGWALKPDARISGFVLRAENPLNWNPPVIYLPTGQMGSAALQRYLKSQSRLQYAYSVDSRGFRVTLPRVESTHKILLIGDSVLFGVGVDDDATIGSQLQRMIGASVQVVNAGVGGYNGPQLWERADRLSRDDAYDALVYVACQNDFMVGGQGSFVGQARASMEHFGALRGRFPRGVLVLLQTTMEYALYDVLQDGGGWAPEMIAGSEQLSHEMPSLAAAQGLGYLYWGQVVDAFGRDQGSVFARFALYTDHVHLSPLGNRLAAEKICSGLQAGSCGTPH